MHEASVVLWGTLGWISLWGVYFALWRPALLRVFEHDLCTIREQLVLEAARGRVKFTDPAFVAIDRLLKGLLSVAADVTISQGLVYTIAKPWMKDDGQSVDKVIESMITEMPDREAAQVLAQTKEDLNRALAFHLTRLYWPVIGAVVMWLLLRLPINALKQVLEAHVKRRRAQASMVVGLACHSV